MNSRNLKWLKQRARHCVMAQIKLENYDRKIKKLHSRGKGQTKDHAEGSGQSCGLFETIYYVDRDWPGESVFVHLP